MTFACVCPLTRTSRQTIMQPGAPVRPTGATSSAGLNAGGEVLLAAGAIHSPQVLMASGVGPASHLAEHGIDVVADLPGVGSNLQDHPAILSAFRFRDDAGRVSITDHIYDDDANIKPLQVRLHPPPRPPRHCGPVHLLPCQSFVVESAQNSVEKMRQQTAGDPCPWLTCRTLHHAKQTAHDHIPLDLENPSSWSSGRISGCLYRMESQLQTFRADSFCGCHALPCCVTRGRAVQLLNWAVRGKGPLTSTGCDRGAFVRTSEDRALPDLQLRFVAGCALDADAIGSYVAFGKMKV